MAQLSSNTVTSSTNVGKYQGVSNPYSELPRQRTIWDKFLNALGMRSGYDKAQEQYNMAGAEYNAQLEQLAAEDRYNSPAEQAIRERAAGLNPDLVGVSGEPGSSFDNQQTPPDVSASADALNTVRSFADGIMNIFTTSLGIANSIQGVVRNKIDNNIARLNLNNGINEYARSVFPYLIPETTQVGEDGSTPTGHFSQLADIFMNGMPKSIRPAFDRSVKAFWHSAPGNAEAYKAWSERIKSRKNYELESHTYYDVDSDEVLSVISDELAKLNEDIIKGSYQSEKASQGASIAQSQNDATYYNSLDSGLQAETENATNEFNKVNLDMNKILNESIGRMIDKLEENRKEKGIGGGLSSIALALLSCFRLMVTTQGLPSVSRSSAVTPNSSKQSFKLGF